MSVAPEMEESSDASESGTPGVFLDNDTASAAILAEMRQLAGKHGLLEFTATRAPFSSLRGSRQHRNNKDSAESDASTTTKVGESAHHDIDTLFSLLASTVSDDHAENANVPLVSQIGAKDTFDDNPSPPNRTRLDTLKSYFDTRSSSSATQDKADELKFERGGLVDNEHTLGIESESVQSSQNEEKAGNNAGSRSASKRENQKTREDQEWEDDAQETLDVDSMFLEMKSIQKQFGRPHVEDGSNESAGEPSTTTTSREKSSRRTTPSGGSFDGGLGKKVKIATEAATETKAAEKEPDIPKLSAVEFMREFLEGETASGAANDGGSGIEFPWSVTPAEKKMLSKTPTPCDPHDDFDVTATRPCPMRPLESQETNTVIDSHGESFCSWGEADVTPRTHSTTQPLNFDLSQPDPLDDFRREEAALNAMLRGFDDDVDDLAISLDDHDSNVVEEVPETQGATTFENGFNLHSEPLPSIILGAGTGGTQRKTMAVLEAIDVAEVFVLLKDGGVAALRSRLSSLGFQGDELDHLVPHVIAFPGSS